MTILSFTAILIIGIYFTIVTFQREGVSIIYNEDISSSSYLNLSTYRFKIAMLDVYRQSFEDEARIFYPAITYWWYNEKMIINEVPLYVIPCRNDWYGNYSDTFYDSDSSYYKFYCIDYSKLGNQDISIFGKYGDSSPFSFLDIQFRRWTNYTEFGKTDCYSDEEIDENLRNSYFVLHYLDYLVDNKNISTPGKYHKNSIALSQTINIFKKYMVNFRKINYFTVIGYIFEDIKDFYFFNIEKFSEEVLSAKHAGEILEMIFTNSKFMGTYERKYLKLQDLLANIGGIVDAILIISTVIENYLVRNVVISQISNEIFNIINYENESTNKTIINNSFKNDLNNSNFPIKNLKDRSNSIKANVNNFISNEQTEGVNMKILQRINKSNEKKTKNILKLSWTEYVCTSNFLKENKNLKLFSYLEDYINSKISINYMIFKLNEIEKLKSVLFSDEEFTAFKFIPNPNISIIRALIDLSNKSTNKCFQKISEEDKELFSNMLKKSEFSENELKIIKLCDT